MEAQCPHQSLSVGCLVIVEGPSNCRREDLEGREAVISMNHIQAQFQPLGRTPRIRAQQHTLTRERKFLFIYLLFMPSTFRKYWRYKPPRCIEVG